MAKTELLRKLDELRPAAVERIIARWGSAELEICFDELVLEEKRASEAGDGKALSLLAQLRALHAQEYPQLAVGRSALAGRLHASADFAVVNRSFPHIGAKLSELWGSQAGDAYIDQLLNDTRGGARHGFPAEVASALLRLSFWHTSEFVVAPTKSRPDAWELS